MSALFRDDAYLKECEATVVGIEDGAVALDRTVFYPMGGGQPGDTGIIAWGGGEVRIRDAVKGPGPDAVKHVIEDSAAAPPVGASVTARIDWDRRYRHMRMHTCLHLLCAVVDGSVTGGQVAADKGRLDFDVPSGSLDREAIEREINRLISEGHPTESVWITDDEMALRPELVRTMSVKPPVGAGRVRLLRIGSADRDAVDLQPCGGTHVLNVAEIGQIVVSKI